MNTKSSVVSFPAAPGAKGQPPNAPMEVSKDVIPACNAANELAFDKP